MPSGEIPDELIPLGWSKSEWTKYLQDAAKYEETATQLKALAGGTGKVLTSIAAAANVLSFMFSQVTFAYFIYEEACQLTEGIIKQLYRCKHYDEAKQVLRWYRDKLYVEYFEYHQHSDTLAPISWEAFKRHLDNVRNFIERYEQLLGEQKY